MGPADDNAAIAKDDIMKIATFDAGHGAQIGIVIDGSIFAVAQQLPQLNDDMVSVIRNWHELKSRFQSIADARANAIELASVKLLAPVQRPGKIMAIGLNYADHIAESGMAAPEKQVWFGKAVTAVNGPFDPVDLPAVPVPHVDYEAELVAIIGSGGRRIARDAAASAVFGYCVGNDVTERAWQHATPQWIVGKSFDTHAPFGPWITTADELTDPHSLDIKCFVNGAVRQSSNTRHLVFDIWDQIEHLSTAMTLLPGDLIFTGTPGGVGAAMNPMQFLAEGDTVRVEIESLGAIENRCTAMDHAHG
jgi:ureidoglycolate lyase